MATTDRSGKEHSATGSPYAKYVLAVLVLVYVFNFIDRQILSILNEEIKADLGLTDSQMGFLYGTVFAVFYAVFGIPLARIADNWNRSRLIAIGLGFWSAMTALSGTARNYLSLSLFRIGVGVGEASATPAAFSILSDYFSPKVRATVLGIYSSGIYIGAGLGIYLGGWILDGWETLYPNPADYPLGIKPWQAAFMAVGLPGLIMALWVVTLREPTRGMSEGISSPVSATPLRDGLVELLRMLPGTGLVWLAIYGWRTVAINLAIAAVLAGAVAALISWLGNPEQWIALGIGVYAVATWVQHLARTDPPAFAMMFKTPAFLLVALCFASISFVTYGIGYWAVPYVLRNFDADKSEVGLYMGLGSAIAGWAGVTLGGFLGDWLMRYTPRGRLLLALVPLLLGIPLVLLFTSTENLILAYVLSFFLNMVFPIWIGAGASTVNDLVMPRMRARASAFYIMGHTFVGLALGPYFIGRVSDYLISTGLEDTVALRYGMITALGMLMLTVLCFIGASLHLPRAVASRLERARAAGEPT